MVAVVPHLSPADYVVRAGCAYKDFSARTPGHTDWSRPVRLGTYPCLAESQCLCFIENGSETILRNDHGDSSPYIPTARGRRAARCDGGSFYFRSEERVA